MPRAFLLEKQTAHGFWASKHASFAHKCGIALQKITRIPKSKGHFPKNKGHFSKSKGHFFENKGYFFKNKGHFFENKGHYET